MTKLSPYEFLATKPGLYLKDFEDLKGKESWRDAFYVYKDLHGVLVLNDVVGGLPEEDCQREMCNIILATCDRLKSPELNALLPLPAFMDFIHRQIDYSQLQQAIKEFLKDAKAPEQLRGLLSYFFIYDTTKAYCSAGTHGHALRAISWTMAWVVAHLQPHEILSKKEVHDDELRLQYHEFSRSALERMIDGAEQISPTT